MDTGLLIIRAVVGLAIAAHGAQKLFGWFGGGGLAGTATAFESLGFRPGKPFAWLAALAEGAGGVALAIGLLTPLTAAVLIGNFIVAIVSAHLSQGFFAEKGGYEYPLLLAAVAAGLAFTGPGALSVDALAGLSLAGPTWGLFALGLGVVGALPPLAVRAFVVKGRTTHATT